LSYKIRKVDYKEKSTKFKDGCLLGCSAVLFGRSLPTFQMPLLPPSSGRSASETITLIALMMEAGRTSETLVNFYQTTRRNNPEESHLRTHCRENLKSYIV
jgi:hypothetical protein